MTYEQLRSLIYKLDPDAWRIFPSGVKGEAFDEDSDERSVPSDDELESLRTGLVHRAYAIERDFALFTAETQEEVRQANIDL